jgi:antitoxin component of MazEF toxin-antitoxin module
MKVTKREKHERPNPEIEVDAFAEDGAVVIQFGDSEIVVNPDEADKLAELIADAAIEATEEDADEAEDEDED